MASSGRRTGRVAVVTGGASGIGRAVSVRLAREGYAVAVLDVDGDGAEVAAAELRAAGGRAVGHRVDVSDRAQLDRAVAAVRSELGPVAVLVTSAAVAVQEPFAETTTESWNRVLAINLTGTFNCVQSVIADMVDAGWGRIVLISSSSGQHGARNMAAYSASKGGVIALTKTLALEYASSGLTVNNIAPSAIDTPSLRRKQEAGMLPASDVLGKNLPVGRIGTGEDIAASCAFLCSDDASFITGQTMGVNGGTFLG
ncbi:SDR family NAD(P)-dependent oxidoreductase [Rhodococcus sp. NPDC003318]|uniref:SDR family NAD(P)-dependent oxidoreductase n=1 Tax=Rhodococcus sp. NPDC003318 TaxID=3364503 RepID=UPI00369DE2D5